MGIKIGNININTPIVQSGVDINEYMSDTITSGDSNAGGWVKTFLKFRSSLKVEGTDASYMFYRCTAITTIPQLDTSNITSMCAMFHGCTSLTTIPQLDTSKVTTMSQMFWYCTSLITIPQLVTSNVTDMYRMFSDCTSLISIPQFDTSKVTDMQSMFNNCKSLTEIPQLDTSSVKRMDYIFGGCESLITIPQLDMSKIVNIGGMFSFNQELTTLGGFTNLGQAYSTTVNANNYNYTLSLSHSKKLTHDSLMNVISNLYDIATKGCKPQKLELGSNKSKLTDEEIAIATNKGWTVS